MAYTNPVPDLMDELENTSVDSESDYTPINEVYFAFINVLGFKKTFDDVKATKEKGNAYIKDFYKIFLYLLDFRHPLWYACVPQRRCKQWHN